MLHYSWAEHIGTDRLCVTWVVYVAIRCSSVSVPVEADGGSVEPDARGNDASKEVARSSLRERVC